jgi:HD-GYP domain-containing protein (c-di-GMP phosphodiesterase class II)
MRLSRTILLLMFVAATVPAAVAVAILAHDAGVAFSGRALAAAAAVALGVASLLSAWCTRRIARPIAACVHGALEIARGRFGHEVVVKARNELGELSYAFNHMSRELARIDRENQELVAALQAGYLATLRTLVSAIDAKDPARRGHSQRVSEVSVAIGKHLGLTDPELKQLAYAALLHDIGKIGIPEAILHKSTALTDQERDQLRAHPALGAELLGGVSFLREALPAVRSHHERWDGQGYPDGLAGAKIPLAARVISAADTFDACTSVRPYQPPLSLDRALEVVGGLRGKQIDPAVCDALIDLAHREGTAALRLDGASTINRL